MRVLASISAIVFGLGLAAPPASAATLDGSVPMLCALTSIVECTHGGDCQRTSAQSAEVPSFIRVDIQKKMLSTVDGARTSPIANVNRADGQLMFQGMQNGRAWGAVIDEKTGWLGSTVSESDGAIVIAGVCTVP